VRDSKEVQEFTTDIGDAKNSTCNITVSDTQYKLYCSGWCEILQEVCYIRKGPMHGLKM
jgi:hypothetical protein